MVAEHFGFLGTAVEFFFRGETGITKNSTFLDFYRVVMRINDFSNKTAIANYIDVPTSPNITVGVKKRFGFNNV